jgi:O-antigen ligase
MWWFLGYVAVYAGSVFFLPEEPVRESVVHLFTLAQVIVLFWIASSLLKEEKLARTVLLTYAFAASILAVGIMIGLPGFSDPTQIVANDARETGLGHNANTLGTIMAMAALAMIGLFINSPKGKKRLLFLLPVTLPLLIMLVKTGSRGAVGAFVIGCAALFLPFLRLKRKVAAIIVAILVIAALGYMVARNPDFVQRWEMAYYKGDLASREAIVPAAIEMILERPLFGWQGVDYIYELGARVRAPGRKDAHNLFLYLFLAAGLVGAIPFLVGLWLCTWAAWKARTGQLGLLPFAMLAAILAANMTHTFIADKAHWLIFSLAVASAVTVIKKQKSPVSVTLKGTRRLVSPD